MSSLQERVAARRAQRAKERTFHLPVRGYEDLGLYAKYKVLSYQDLRDIDIRNDDSDGPEGELARYATTLLEACVDLAEKVGDHYKSLNCKWSSSPLALRENLGIDIPDGATSREALFEVFNGESGGNDLFLHWNAWDREASKSASEIDEEQAGESQPSVEG